MYDSISQFAEKTGLTPHTLRYYEKEGLFTPKRLSNGHRCYTEQDINWVVFIKKLKDTHMPIKRIKEYARLRALGNSTLAARMELLQEHQQLVLKTVTAWQEYLHNLNDKIDFYKRELLSNQDKK